MAGNVRQHYALATGGGLAQTDGRVLVKKYAKGGKVIGPKSNVQGKDDKFTSLTHKGAFRPKGFKVHGP